MVTTGAEVAVVQRKAGEMAVVQRKAGEPPALQMPKADFLKRFSPLPAMAECAAITSPVMAAASAEMPTLAAMRRQYGDTFVLGYVKLWIIDLIDYLGGKEMTDTQLEETAQRIFQNNYYLNVADINILLNRVKDGDISIATPINGAKLNRLFADYREERIQAVADSHINQHDVLKKHGYIPHLDHITEAVREAMIENQMVAAERQAKAEQAEIDRQYRQACRYAKILEKYPGLKRREERGERKN